MASAVADGAVGGCAWLLGIVVTRFVVEAVDDDEDEEAEEAEEE